MDRPAQNAIAIGGMLVLAAAIHLMGARVAAREAQPGVVVEDFAMPDLEDDTASGVSEPPASNPTAGDEPSSAAPGNEQPPAAGSMAHDASEAAGEPTEGLASNDAETGAEILGDPIAGGVPEGYAEKLLFQPELTAAGRLEAQGYSIILSGVEPIETNEICGEGRKNTWPCGATALTQFRNYVRGRALSCLVPEEPTPQPIETTCTLGGDDVSAWLIGQGWGRARADGALGQVSAAAQSAGLGIWGSRP